MYACMYVCGSNIDWVNSIIISGRSPPLYCTLIILIAMQGHTEQNILFYIFSAALVGCQPEKTIINICIMYGHT